MLTLKLLRDDPEFVIRKLAVKHFDAREIVCKIVELDKTRRALQMELDGTAEIYESEEPTNEMEM